jgi:hypothetical protein
MHRRAQRVPVGPNSGPHGLRIQMKARAKILHDAFIVGVIVQPSGDRPRPGNARINPLGDGGMLFLGPSAGILQFDLRNLVVGQRRSFPPRASLWRARKRPAAEAALLQDQPQSGTGRSRDGNGYRHG